MTLKLILGQMTMFKLNHWFQIQNKITSSTHHSAEEDSPAFLAVAVVVVLSCLQWVGQATYQAVEEQHGLLGTLEAPACLGVEV